MFFWIPDVNPLATIEILEGKGVDVALLRFKILELFDELGGEDFVGVDG